MSMLKSKKKKKKRNGPPLKQKIVYKVPRLKKCLD